MLRDGQRQAPHSHSQWETVPHSQVRKGGRRREGGREGGRRREGGREGEREREREREREGGEEGRREEGEGQAISRPTPCTQINVMSHDSHVTCSHLCFERHQRQQRDLDRFKISLYDVTQVVKAKPFAVLPGSGMSIEITLKTGVKVQWEENGCGF